MNRDILAKFIILLGRKRFSNIIIDKPCNLLHQMAVKITNLSGNENHTGPGAVGNKTPTRDVIIQMIIAIINA